MVVEISSLEFKVAWYSQHLEYLRCMSTLQAEKIWNSIVCRLTLFEILALHVRMQCCESPQF